MSEQTPTTKDIKRAYVNYDAYNVQIHLQDNGRTVKVFIGN